MQTRGLSNPPSKILSATEAILRVASRRQVHHHTFNVHDAPLLRENTEQVCDGATRQCLIALRRDILLVARLLLLGLCCRVRVRAFDASFAQQVRFLAPSDRAKVAD